MNTPILRVQISFEQDVVLSRQRTWQIAKLLGFNTQEQTRLATAVSEIARNAFQYAQGGKIEFFVVGEIKQSFLIRISDRGLGIPNLQQVLDGKYLSHTGMGLGIVGAKRLMDRFEIQSVSGEGTTVIMEKALPASHPLLFPPDLAKITDELVKQKPQNPFEEVQRQNQELLQALEELRKREERLNELNQELAETNRGVVALYAELDEKANSLLKANELKSLFLSYTSHEFRTPLNSMISMSRLLLDRMDGELTPEQEKQINFIRQAAVGLSDLVNDLLDLAKVESGKLDVYPHHFELRELVDNLKGLMHPLMVHNSSVSLVFDLPNHAPQLYTDQGKLAQILRNLISNAIKYTHKGEVKIQTHFTTDTVTFAVIDSGIGIAPEDQTRIFEDFTQLDSSLQKRVKGTGLGLPLSRKLAELLGGKIYMESEPGVGSTFYTSIPLLYSDRISNNFYLKNLRERTTKNYPPNFSNNHSSLSTREIKASETLEETANNQENQIPENQIPKLLLIDDDIKCRYLFKKFLTGSLLTILEATNGQQGVYLAQNKQPQAIILDLMMPELTGWQVLEQLNHDPRTANIPVVIYSSQTITPAQEKYLAQRAIAILSKDSTSFEATIDKIRRALGKVGIFSEAS